MRKAVWMGALLMAPLLARADMGLLDDGYGYSRAVLTAELGKLQNMGKARGAHGRLGAAGYYRVRGELDNSTRAAQDCLQSAAASPPASVKGVAFLCEATLAGNALIQGDIAGWARHLQAARGEYERSVKPMMTAQADIEDIALPRLERFLAWPRSSLASAPRTSDVEVPIQPSDELPTLTATLKVTGGAGREQTLTFLLDTGAARSHLSRAAAQALGLTVVEDFVVARNSSGERLPGPLVGLVSPVDLSIGGEVVRDVSFNSEAGYASNVIGLDVLRALGRVRISQQTLTLLAADTVVECTRRMATTSSLWGPFHQQRYPLRGDKENQLMLVDTGFNGTFQMRGAPRTIVPPGAIRRKNVITSRGAQDIEYAAATTPVTINGAVATIPVDVAFQAPDLFASSWRIGYGVTVRYDLYMDMPGTYGCLIERPVTPLLPPAPSPQAAAAA